MNELHEVSEIPVKKLYNTKTKSLYESIIKPNQLVPNSNEVICKVKLIAINYETDFEFLKKVGYGICDDYNEETRGSRSSSIQSSIFTKKRDSNSTNASSNKNSIVSNRQGSVQSRQSTPNSKNESRVSSRNNSIETENIKLNFSKFKLNDNDDVINTKVDNYGYYGEYLLNSTKSIIPTNKIIIKIFKVGSNINLKKQKLSLNSKYLVYPFHNCISLNFTKPCENCTSNYTKNCLNANEIGLNIEGGLQDYLILTNPNDFLIEIPPQINSHDALLSLDLMFPFYTCLKTYNIKPMDNILIIVHDKAKQINDFLLVLKYLNYTNFKFVDNLNVIDPSSEYLKFTYVIDFICNKDSINFSLDNLLPQSKYIIMSKKFKTVPVPVHKIFLKNISIHSDLNYCHKYVTDVFKILINTPKSKNHSWLYYNKDFVNGDLSIRKINNLFNGGYDRFCYSNKNSKNTWV